MKHVQRVRIGKQPRRREPDPLLLSLASENDMPAPRCWACEQGHHHDHLPGVFSNCRRCHLAGYPSGWQVSLLRERGILELYCACCGSFIAPFILLPAPTPPPRCSRGWPTIIWSGRTSCSRSITRWKRSWVMS